MVIDILIKVRSSYFQYSMDFLKLPYSFRSYTIVYVIIFIGLNFYIPEVKSAFEKKEAGASSFAIGNAAVAIDEYLFALYYNPAALSAPEKFQIAFSLQNYLHWPGIRSRSQSIVSVIEVIRKFNLLPVVVMNF